ncbi:MAG: tyrosine-type recombinase/integrase [Lacrimispora sp.]|uniref:tyrosine-type recombinase/integrase n=1 Tax=Lacrimispora sp. TaxID=2719234 RepID=UPI0039E3A69F
MAKRGQGEGTISKRPDGTWWARVSLGYDGQGKRKRKAFYGKTRKEVQEKLTAALNDINNDEYVESSDMTFERWLDVWLLEYKKNYIEQRTYNIYRRYSKRVIKGLGHYKIKDLKPSIIQKYINDEIQVIEYSGVEKCRYVIRASLQQAVKNKMLKENVATECKIPDKKAKEKRILTPAEQDDFIKAASQMKGCEVFIMALATGMRIGELLALQWSDVDFEAGIVTVNKTQIKVFDVDDPDTKLTWSVGPPKTKSSNRVIPLLPAVNTLFEILKQRQAENKIRYGKKYKDSDFVFCHKWGGMMSYDYAVSQLDRLKKELGMDGISPHALRHTFATRGLESGVELKVMQELLGHSSINMTADLYTHVLVDKKKSSIMKMENTIKI